jgi:hypothetical protein
MTPWIKKLTNRLTVVVFLIAAGVFTPAQAQEARLDTWLDPDLAGFILQNAHQLRYEIRDAKGPRLVSLLRQMQLRDSQFDQACLQRIAEATDGAYELYSRLTDADYYC